MSVEMTATEIILRDCLVSPSADPAEKDVICIHKDRLEEIVNRRFADLKQEAEAVRDDARGAAAELLGKLSYLMLTGNERDREEWEKLAADIQRRFPWLPSAAPGVEEG